MKRILIILVASTLLIMPEGGIGQTDTLWGALKSGNHLVLVRHALAPGFGDPEEFDVKDCRTQRNLNDEGRRQSKNIGDMFRSNGIDAATVYSSQWCRCLDTAELVDLGQVLELPALNSFYEEFSRAPLQTKEIQSWIKNAPLRTPTVLVSHQVNITALTGYSPASGEIVFIRRNSDGSLAVIGSVRTLR